MPFGGSHGGHLPIPFGQMFETRAARPVRNKPYFPVAIAFLSSRYASLPRRFNPTATICREFFWAFTIARPSATVAVRGFSQ